jgi:hypothetical protein
MVPTRPEALTRGELTRILERRRESLTATLLLGAGEIHRQERARLGAILFRFRQSIAAGGPAFEGELADVLREIEWLWPWTGGVIPGTEPGKEETP